MAFEFPEIKILIDKLLDDELERVNRYLIDNNLLNEKCNNFVTDYKKSRITYISNKKNEEKLFGKME